MYLKYLAISLGRQIIFTNMLPILPNTNKSMLDKTTDKLQIHSQHFVHFCHNYFYARPNYKISNQFVDLVDRKMCLINQFTKVG